MTINNVSILSDSLRRMKELIASGITDPISASRSASSRFVMSTFPERNAEYPLITVSNRHGPSDRLGMQSEVMNLPVQFTVQVWGDTMKNKDTLAGSVLNLLRVSQYGIDSIANTGTGTNIEGLYDLQLTNMFDLDEEGKKGLHRKVIEFNYNFMAG